jgi:ABC-type branched-subunit amino acid transport system substrate-binding protein
MAAKGLAGVLAKEIGKSKKVAYLRPDYTHGHSVFDAIKEFTGKEGWTVATNQVAPLGTTDSSSYLLNIVNSDADVFVNVAFGADAVASSSGSSPFS